MNNIKELFPEFYQDKLDDGTMINSEDSLVVIDTNYLLNILELPITLSKKYLEALKKVSNNIYIPYLVALEFNFNKSRVKKQKSKKIKEYKKRIEEKIDALEEIINDGNLITSQEILNNHLEEIKPIINQLKNELLKSIDTNIENLLLKGEKCIYNQLILFLSDKIGNQYTKDWIEEGEKEAKERFDKNIPPGNDDIIKDDEKDRIRYYNGLSYQRKYGDYLIWKDILDYSSKIHGKKRLIFVTSDGTSKKKMICILK